MSNKGKKYSHYAGAGLVTGGRRCRSSVYERSDGQTKFVAKNFVFSPDLQKFGMIVAERERERERERE
jgi:hypothetical protein